MRTASLRASFLSLAFVAAWTCSACQSSGSNKSASTVDGMSRVETSLGSSKSAIEEVVAALRQVEQSAKTDPRPAFDDFCAKVEHLDGAVANSRERADALRSTAADYHERWESDLAEIQNESIREKSRKRHDQAVKKLDKLSKQLADFDAKYAPFAAHLHDIKVYLGNDLSPGGIESMKDEIGDAEDEGKDLVKRIDELAAEVSASRSEIAPPPPAPEPQPEPTPQG